MPLDLDIDQERLRDLCRRYRVASLELFGSRAHGTARVDSDVDLLVTFVGGRSPGLAFVTMAEELEAIFGRHVDLLVRDTVERDENPVRRASILRRTVLLFVGPRTSGLHAPLTSQADPDPQSAARPPAQGITSAV
jgi:predicted nucleotidyltransferase